ncbi:MAG: bifunctional DNA-formamidopyrimidine glycosylase/DNA-(apurinic or apyrimidinic site) lyase [Myxococcales bacterium]|nr:bifunctional DNA-formamidopyrimidine glycosylase/DNA-(apurinic or apyrimidinic site) lyase [Myxococcales bacterium]
MPELPEVEIAARGLRAWMGGRRIAEVRVAATRIVRGTSRGAVERLCDGQQVREVVRRGKWIRLGLDGGGALFSHLGMSGKWVVRAREEEASASERARFTVGGRSVRYHDPRMFGRLVPSLDGAPIAEWSALGRDPLGDGIETGWLGDALRRRRVPLKVALLDQTLVAGIGNIQATEALWRARLHPERRSDGLMAAEAKRLCAGILGSIEATLRAEEGGEITYVEEDRSRNPFAIYGRGGQPCPRCRAMLVRIVLAGRGTVFCARCQPPR